MYFDEFKHQLPDIDPSETEDWLASLDQVVADEGEARARFIIYKLLKRARQLQVGLPPLTQTRYINTISPEQEPAFPGDEAMERRIRRLIRWNAVAMVLRANNQYAGIGGHLATYASAATLYEVGFNHFFRGKDGGASGDQIFYQGHAAPGIYARAFLEGRLSVDQLDHFRRETVPGQGLSSYPHPRLMPEFWEFPTVSMGLGPISAIYQARYNRYLHNRGLLDTSTSRVWAFMGDGESDEPESLGALHVAAREGLDNLTFVVNCNLQRLDGPVRGNGKIIQELESAFRGAGWNVIKVIWGREWDELLARDVDGLLVQQMNESLTLPGVSTNRFGLGISTFSVNGSRGRSNNFLLDGTENNDISVAGQAFQVTNPDAVQEISVQTGNYDAEYGRAGGAVVNTITRSGTNAYHGTAGYLIESTRFDAITTIQALDPAVQTDHAKRRSLQEEP